MSSYTLAVNVGIVFDVLNITQLHYMVHYDSKKIAKYV